MSHKNTENKHILPFISTISGETKLACLLGSPVAHSISPSMHNEAFRLLGIDCRYLAFDVDTDHLFSVVEGLKHMGVIGFNLTMPNKNLMASYCDELSQSAQLGQSVNTVKIENGKLIGYTTDGIGFMDACKHEGFDIIGKKMTLLGAGGASCAILVQAALDGVKEITVFNRRNDNFIKAKQLANKLKDVSSCNINIYDYDDPALIHTEISTSAILVNGTSVGMSPNENQCILKDFSCFHKDLMVYDVIYHPRETRLLKEAKKAGCNTANGLYMLFYQGAAAFEIWTGQKMPVEEIAKLYSKTL